MQRTKEDLTKHLERCAFCGSSFIICVKKYKENSNPTETSGSITPLPLFCSSYFCERCKDKKTKMLYKKIFCGLQKETWRFITFTTNRTIYSDEENLQLINEAWNKMLTFLRKHNPQIKFVKVLEISDKNFVHLHVLINKYIPQPLLRKYWEKYTSAFIVNIERPKNIHKTAAYICSYISKNINSFSNLEKFFINRKRKYSFSRNWNFKFEKKNNFQLLTKKIYSSDKLCFSVLSILENQFYKIDEFCFDFLPPPLAALISDSSSLF